MPILIVTAIRSAFTKIFTYLLGSGALKWIIFALMAYGFSHLIDLLITLIPEWVTGLPLSELMSGIPSGIWYFIDYFEVQYGLSLMFSAYIARFLIRRIPFVG